MAIGRSERLVVVSAYFLPYFYYMICRWLVMQLFLPLFVVVIIGGVIAGLLFLAMWKREDARNVLFVAMPLAVLATSIDDLDANLFSLTYLLIIACMSENCTIRTILCMAFFPVLFCFSGWFLPRQSAVWLILLLLFAIGNARAHNLRIAISSRRSARRERKLAGRMAFRQSGAF